ncbi:MAG: hypothetical protein ABI402_13200 [Ferruginibacter sp.]
MDIHIQMQLQEPVSSNPKFESDVSNFIHSYWASASPVAEWQLWNKDFFGPLGNRIGFSRRGNVFDMLGGNNLGRTYANVDYLKGGIVGSIKSTRVTDTKALEKVVRDAYKSMINAIKNDRNLSSVTGVELKIIIPSGTSRSVIETIERTSERIHLRNSGIRFNPPKIIRGIPGNAGAFLRGMGIVGGFFSAVQLYHDVKKGDVASGVGSGSSTAATVLEISGGLLSSTALAMSAAVVGSFAIGYSAGTIINDHLISGRVKDIIGGTMVELVDNGWENIKEFYFGKKPHH